MTCTGVMTSVAAWSTMRSAHGLGQIARVFVKRAKIELINGSRTALVAGDDASAVSTLVKGEVVDEPSGWGMSEPPCLRFVTSCCVASK